MVFSLLKCFYAGIATDCYHGRHTLLQSGKVFSSIPLAKRQAKQFISTLRVFQELYLDVMLLSFEQLKVFFLSVAIRLLQTSENSNSCSGRCDNQVPFIWREVVPGKRVTLPSESTSQRSLISQKRCPFSQKPPALAHPLIRDFKIQRRDGHENFA